MKTNTRILIPIEVVAVLGIAFAVMLLAGACWFAAPGKPAEPAQAAASDQPDIIPGSGGEMSGDIGPSRVVTKEYPFTPGKAGFWLFSVQISVQTYGGGVGEVEILGPDGDTIVEGSNSETGDLTIVYLDAENPYTVKLTARSLPPSKGVGYTLTASLAQEIPGSGGEVRVDSTTVFSFTPDRSGTWTFSTSDNGECIPYLLVRDANNTSRDFVYYDRGERGEDDIYRNVLLSVPLDEGAPYMVEAGSSSSGSFVLAVSPA